MQFEDPQECQDHQVATWRAQILSLQRMIAVATGVDPGDPDNSAEEQALLSAFRRLPASERQHIVRSVQLQAHHAPQPGASVLPFRPGG